MDKDEYAMIQGELTKLLDIKIDKVLSKKLFGKRGEGYRIGVLEAKRIIMEIYAKAELSKKKRGMQ